MITRRKFLKFMGIATVGGLTLGGYAFGLEPMRGVPPEINLIEIGGEA